MNLQEAKELYIKAKDAYYNSGKPIITDAQFDKLENWIAKKDPTWPELHKTGILPTDIIGKKTKVKLPFFMPSLNKFYPEEVDKLWKKLPVVSEYVYMDKLDGCSVLLEYENGKPTKLTTRGNGEIGQDISFFIPYILILTCLYKYAILFLKKFLAKQKSHSREINLQSGFLRYLEF